MSSRSAQNRFVPLVADLPTQESFDSRPPPAYKEALTESDRDT